MTFISEAIDCFHSRKTKNRELNFRVFENGDCILTMLNLENGRNKSRHLAKCEISLMVAPSEIASSIIHEMIEVTE